MSKTKRSAFVALGGTVVLLVGLGTWFSLFGRAGFPRGPGGSYMVSVVQKDNPNARMDMLATFTDGGQIISSDTTDFGFSPAGCSDEAPDKSQSAGHGVWERRGLQVFFQVRQLRFNQGGFPVGFLRVFGSGRLGKNNNVEGRATIQFVRVGDPGPNQRQSETPICSINATFVAVPMTARPPRGPVDRSN